MQANIIFIFSDQQHWQAVGFEDDSFDTPSLDNLASKGTVFCNSFCTTPQCSPSRSSMLTGFYPSKTGVLGNIGAAGGEVLEMTTIGKMLQDEGYYTGYFGKWHLGKNSTGTAGWDEDFGVTGAETTDDEAVTKYALDFIKRMSDINKPCALFLSYNNPHDIYDFWKTKDYLSDKNIELPDSWHKQNFDFVPSVQEQFMLEDQGTIIYSKDEDAWKKYRDIYRKKVKLYDNEVGKVLGCLKEQKLYDDAFVVATSDHGDMDGQHRLIYKGPFMYEHMMRVPLIIKYPNQQKKIETEFNTVNVDLVPTIMDIACNKKVESDGVSLKPLLVEDGNIPMRDFVVGQYYSKQKWVNPIRMIRGNGFKYNEYCKHGAELYNLNDDPNELNNSVNSTKYIDEQKRLKAFLYEWIEENDDPFFSQRTTDRNGNELCQ